MVPPLDVENLGREKADDVYAAGVPEAVIDDAVSSRRALLLAKNLASIERAPIVENGSIGLAAANIDSVIPVEARAI